MYNYFRVFLIFLVYIVNIYASQDTSSLKNIPINQKGILELNNANTVLSIGGRIELHSIYGWPEGTFLAGKIPIEDAGENGQFSMNARKSRLWVKTRTPSEYGAVRTLIEIDFLGYNSKDTEATLNSNTPRLRHAYVEANGFTFGQTNSAFNSVVTLDTIAYVINDTMVRQPVIRYAIEEKEFIYDISFEQPESTLLDSNGSMITPKDDILPDIIARVRHYQEWGEASIAFMARCISQDHAKLSNDNILNTKDRAYAGAVNVSAKIKVHKLNDIRFDAQYGLGLGRYLSYNAYPAGSIDVNGNIQLQHSYGMHIGYRHWWSKKLRSTLALSYSGTKNNSAIKTNLDDVNKHVYSSQLNLLWMPIPNALVGVEYDKAVHSVQSGKIGNMDMLLFLIRYDF